MSISDERWLSILEDPGLSMINAALQIAAANTDKRYSMAPILVKMWTLVLPKDIFSGSWTPCQVARLGNRVSMRF